MESLVFKWVYTESFGLKLIFIMEMILNIGIKCIKSLYVHNNQ